MSQRLPSRFAVCLFGLALAAAALVGACSGGEFTEAGGAAGSAAGGAGGGAGTSPGGGGGAVPPGGTVLCKGPADCDDMNPCTLEECSSEGTCVYSAKCGAEERCCDGVCSQCCAQADCNDGVTCTADQCFAGFCAVVPDDEACGADEYCHTTDDCKAKEMCASGMVGDCDDGDPCTEDNCSAGLCEHSYCSGGEQCCPGVGCATCCQDSQCEDDELCTKEVCSEGRCQSAPLCADGRCCEGADSASCGACCEPEDCPSTVECTVAGCLEGRCTYTPHSELCSDTQTCDPAQGCVEAAMCNDAADCASQDPCLSGDCVDGKCQYTGCQNGQECCPGVGCRACCDNSQCAGQLCCNGVCQQCCMDYDCSNATVPPPPAPLPGSCAHNLCTEGLCTTLYDFCGGINDVCCAPYGCYTGGCPI